MKLRTFRNSAKKVCAVGVKFEFELYDNFIGQFATTFFPHCDVDAFCRPMNFGAFKGVEWAELNYTKHFVGVLSYLMTLTCDALDASTLWCGDCKLSAASFPYEKFPVISPGSGELFTDPAVACGYLLHSMTVDLYRRFSSPRCETFRWHILAKWHLLRSLSRARHTLGSVIHSWNHIPIREIVTPTWSADQKAVLDDIAAMRDPIGDNVVDEVRPIYLGGDQGTGKSEVLVHAALEAADSGAKVLLMCPTGTLVHAYRERLPAHANITIETIHSAMVIVRDNDKVVMYAPPSRLRRYDVFLLDEGSQIDDPVAIRLQVALSELPHSHVLVVAADYRQLRPIAGGSHMLHWCMEMKPHYLTIVHRTKDPVLLSFLQFVRVDQPSRPMLNKFWRGFRLNDDLMLAVQCGHELGLRRGHAFVWLCVTNKGANLVNEKALTCARVTAEERLSGYNGDPNANAGKLFIKSGLRVRLTRNLDKSRGFVNGAMATVETVLCQFPLYYKFCVDRETEVCFIIVQQESILEY